MISLKSMKLLAKEHVMNRSIIVLGVLGIVITVMGVMFRNPYFLVIGVVIAAFAIIRFARYMNDQLPDDIGNIPDLSKAKVTRLNVADMAHHMDDFLSLAAPNPDYSLDTEGIIKKGLEDTMIYEYNFPSSIELKRAFPDEYNPEPVDVLLDGKIIGSIPIKKSPYIYVLVGMKGIRYMENEISGGNYKMVHNGRMETGKREYRVSLTIYGDA